LVVHPKRDEANRQQLETIDGALAQFDGPFTISELEGVFGRHMPDNLAREYVSAALGLDRVAELSPPLGSGDRWFAPLDLIQDELASFGRALVLSTRYASPRLKDGSQQQPGFSADMASLFGALAQAPDFAFIAAYAPREALMQDLAAWAQAQDILPVTILHAAGTRPPKSVCRSLDEVLSKPITNACMLVETPDALTAAEIDLVLQAAHAGCNRLVFVRPAHSAWPRLELLDLFSRHVPVLHWPAGEGARAQLPVEQKLELAESLNRLHRAGQLQFVRSRSQVRQEVARALRAHHSDGISLVIPNARMRKVAKRVLSRTDASIAVAAYVDENLAGQYLLPIVEETISSTAAVLLGEDSAKLRLLVDEQLAGNIDELAAQLSRSGYPSSAICHSDVGASLDFSGAWPLMGVNGYGHVVTSRDRVAEAIRFWTQRPGSLDWSRANTISDQELDAALAAGMSRSGASSFASHGYSADDGMSPKGDPAPIGEVDDAWEQSLRIEAQAEKALQQEAYGLDVSDHGEDDISPDDDLGADLHTDSSDDDWTWDEWEVEDGDFEPE
jgi:hypothetical protein